MSTSVVLKLISCLVVVALIAEPFVMRKARIKKYSKKARMNMWRRLLGEDNKLPSRINRNKINRFL